MTPAQLDYDNRMTTDYEAERDAEETAAFDKEMDRIIPQIKADLMFYGKCIDYPASMIEVFNDAFTYGEITSSEAQILNEELRRLYLRYPQLQPLLDPSIENVAQAAGEKFLNRN